MYALVLFEAVGQFAVSANFASFSIYFSEKRERIKWEILAAEQTTVSRMFCLLAMCPTQKEHCQRKL